MANTVPVTRFIPIQRKTSIEIVGDKLVGMLDEIEKRVENLRETASVMEQEKEALMEMLSTVQLNKDMLRMGTGDREDIEATTNRLMVRCRTVEVTVSTPRNQDQQRALQNVNQQIEELVAKTQDDLCETKQKCRRYLNACHPDDVDGPVDQRFQSSVIECTADDQKKIRRRLQHLISLLERAEKTVNQANF